MNSNINKLNAYIEKKIAEGLVDIKLWPQANLLLTQEQLAGNVLALLEAKVVDDNDLF